MNPELLRFKKKPLTTDDLTLALLSDTNTKQQFGDVCSITELPEKIQGKIYIVNTDPHWLPGTHWVTCYFPTVGPAEFFDSLGHGPHYYYSDFQVFLLRNSNKGYVYNKKNIQAHDSKTCGYYCLFYCLHRARGIPMNHIINAFTNEPWINDWMVYQFIKQHYNL